jgi:predicted nucleotidyltransferase component of viral defense system
MIKINHEVYNTDIVKKVDRLVKLLAEINRHPYLSERVSLHGGTAINLFLLDAPRLSIDADLTYIGSANKEKTDEERPIVEESIEELGGFLGYNVTPTKSADAGRTFRLRYNDDGVNDYIKIDINYLNRVPLIPVKESTCVLDDNVNVSTFAGEELIAGKVKALFDRVAVRDIYDISSIYERIPDLFDVSNPNAKLRLHRTILFYASLSNLFPTCFEGLTTARFAGRETQVVNELYPVLQANDRPRLKDMIEKAELFVAKYVIPRDEDEKQFLECFASAIYKPKLLFAQWPEILERAKNNPSAKWKLLNLQKMADLQRHA